MHVLIHSEAFCSRTTVRNWPVLKFTLRMEDLRVHYTMNLYQVWIFLRIKKLKSQPIV